MTLSRSVYVAISLPGFILTSTILSISSTVAIRTEALLLPEKPRFRRVLAFGYWIAVKFAVFLRIARRYADG
jgi:hypothetical protein